MRMARLLGAGLAFALLSTWLALPWPLEAAGFRMTRVTCLENGRTALVGEHARRTSVRFINLGGATVFLGGTIGDHVGGNNSWPLHAAGAGQYLNQTHAVVLFGGGAVECLVPNTPAGSTVQVGILEEFN